MVMIPKIRENELTGRARVRQGWFGRLILQVETETLAYSACPPMPGRNRHEWRDLMRSEGARSYSWSDASLADMQALARIELIPVGAIAGGSVPPKRSPPATPPMPMCIGPRECESPATCRNAATCIAADQGRAPAKKKPAPKR